LDNKEISKPTNPDPADQSMNVKGNIDNANESDQQVCMLLITVMNLLTVTYSGSSKIFLQELGNLIKLMLQILRTFKKMDWDHWQLMAGTAILSILTIVLECFI
jgi:phosphatidylglycerophosphatase A